MMSFRTYRSVCITYRNDSTDPLNCLPHFIKQIPECCGYEAVFELSSAELCGNTAYCRMGHEPSHVVVTEYPLDLGSDELAEAGRDEAGVELAARSDTRCAADHTMRQGAFHATEIVLRYRLPDAIEGHCCSGTYECAFERSCCDVSGDAAYG